MAITLNAGVQRPDEARTVRWNTLLALTRGTR